MTGISRRDFVALTAAGAVATPFVLDDALARARRRGDGAGDRRSREEEHRRRLEQRRRRYVQGGRSVDGRHRRGDDVDGDAGRAPEGRAGRREFRHHRGADVLLEGGPEHARGPRVSARAAAGRGQPPARRRSGGRRGAALRRRRRVSGPGTGASAPMPPAPAMPQSVVPPGQPPAAGGAGHASAAGSRLRRQERLHRRSTSWSCSA